jgi:putative endonuclease
LYIGVTGDLVRRMSEHYLGFYEGFTKKYQCKYLIWYQHYSDINLAIRREKQLKKWSRHKKEELVSALNPEWKFLNESVPFIISVY